MDKDPIFIVDLELFNEGGQSLLKSKNNAEEEALNRRVKEVADFLKKTKPAIDFISSIDNAISLRGGILYYNGKKVHAVDIDALNYSEAIDNAKSVITDCVNGFASIAKSGYRSLNEDLLIKFCCQYNTLSGFLEKVDLIKSELEDKTQKNISKQSGDDNNDFSESIVIPFGKSQNGEVAIDFNMVRPDAHAVVSGMSGSGKSSLLQSIIISGAYKYSPDKLKFWILDFKDGTGLIQFKDLKHTAVMSVKNRAVDAYEIMDMIKAEYTRRGEEIRNIGGGDIRNYNRLAAAENKPLMPRLLIIIDEFTVMPRQCFATLNEMAKLGRSMGMGFILSSQVIETGAYYGDAVGQANHLFEFKNSDSLFGRLVKNVTEEERRFACSGVAGNCIYRKDTVKTPFRVAYAGDIYNQNALIRRINEKWSNYKYVEPIITGSPERKVVKSNMFSKNIKEQKQEFSRTKRILVPLGESRTGKKYLYKIDHDNPLLVAFGDETRVASSELCIIEKFKALSDLENNVIYIDLNCNPDRQENAVTSACKEGEFTYIASDTGAAKAIDGVYRILKERRRITREDRTKDIGAPIELIIHNAERIREFKVKQPDMSISRSNTATSSNNLDLEEMLAQVGNKSQKSNQPENIDVIKELSEIIETGKDSRIYVMLYFEEVSRFQSIMSELIAYGSIKDVLIVPRIPDEYEEPSFADTIDALNVCQLREQASIFTQDNYEKSDFICAVLVDDKALHKIIPYERKV